MEIIRKSDPAGARVPGSPRGETPSRRAEASPGSSFEVSLMAGALGALFAAGGTLALLSVVLPHNARANELGLLITVGTAYLVAGGLLWR
ncbi:MAG: hypothetical protein H0V29_03650, partial [Thermoleophilaceae bacterium]|nr:hypothetical protein [Thermoleophilaceae bacterium]